MLALFNWLISKSLWPLLVNESGTDDFAIVVWEWLELLPFLKNIIKNNSNAKKVNNYYT